MNRLTQREKQILTLLMICPDYDTCSKKLVISKTTLKTHVSNIFMKLEVNSLAELLSKMFLSSFGLKLIRRYRKELRDERELNCRARTTI